MKRATWLSAIVGVCALAGSTRGAAPEGLFFREDTRDTPAALPITQRDVSWPGLTLRLYGPGRSGVKKSHHAPIRNDPHYVWSGECKGRWAVAFARQGASADLSGADARIRLRTRNAQRTLHVILKTPAGWLVSDRGAAPSEDWTTTVLKVRALSWSRLDPSAVTRGAAVRKPPLEKVSEVGFTDLQAGGASAACSRVDWIEVWEKLPREAIYVVPAADGYQVYDGDQGVLFYHTRANAWKGRYARADYVHPLIGLDGEVLTEDFPADHPHHRGVFWAWHQVLAGGRAMGDSWACRDIVWDVRSVKVLAGEDGSAALKADVHWKSPHWKGAEPFLAHTVTLRVHRVANGARAIDFTIALRAPGGNVQIGGADNDKAYGGFSVRIRLPGDLVMTGPKGRVTAKRTPVAAGGWLNFAGTFGGAKSGLAVLVHPSCPGGPQPWILRRSKSCQNAVYPGRRPVSVPADRPLVLKYRLLIHRDADVAKHFAEWTRKRSAAPPDHRRSLAEADPSRQR